MRLSKLSKEDDILPTTPLEVDDVLGRKDEYYVEKILDKKMMMVNPGHGHGGEEEEEEMMHYEVQWNGWCGKEFNTWEPYANLLDGAKEELKEFEERWEKKTARIAESFKAGIHWTWPEGKEPLAMIGCFVHDRLLTYIIKIATDKNPPSIEGLTNDNLVIVRGRDFRLRYPQIVLEYYQKNILSRRWPAQNMGAKVEKELARVKALTTKKKKVEEEEQQQPSTDCELLDQFGLPILNGEASSESDNEDIFEEIVDAFFNPGEERQGGKEKKKMKDEVRVMKKMLKKFK